MSDRPSKFIIETALDLGIENTKKSKNLSQEEIKREYEKAKIALNSGNESEEIQGLYRRFIELYDKSVASTTASTNALSESIKWKNISDLKEAVKNGGKGLSLADIEGLNQYALAEYARQQARDVGQQDDTVLTTLKSWFQIYEKIKAETVETQKLGFDAALRDAFLKAEKVPFDFEYRENGETKKVTVNLKDNTLIIGGRTHTLKGEKIKIGILALDAQKFYIPYTQDGVQRNSALTLEKAEFLKRYMKDILDGKDIKIDQNLVHVDRSGEVNPALQGTASTTVPETRKYDLAKCAGYAAQELKRYGKTIKELQSALKAKQFYKGEVNVKFDQATLDAVIAFQKTIKEAKYGPDGLVGDETISNLFGIKPQPILSPSRPSHQTPRRVDGISPVPGSPRRMNAAGPSPSVQGVPAESTDALNKLFSNVEKAYITFMNEADAADILGAGFRKSEEQIQKERKSLMEKQGVFQKTIGEYLSAGGNNERINHFRLNIAYYYSNDLKGVNNTTNVNPQIAQGILLSVLGKKIKPVPSFETSFFDTLATIAGTPLGDMIAGQVKKRNITSLNDLAPILANPAVKGGWDEAYNKILDKQLKELDSSIDVLTRDESKLTSLEKKALDHLRDMRGKNGWWDLKTENREQMWQMLRYGSAIGLGIAGTVLTATGVGSIGGAPLVALSASALAGAAITTGGTLLAQGYYTSGLDSAQEFGINLISFGGGAIIFKTASGIRAARSLSQVAGGILTATEMGANVAIGVGTDNLRAQLKGVDLDIWNSIQQNLIWAALPLALSRMGKSIPKSVDDNVKKANASITQAKIQSALGKPVTEELKNVDEAVKVLKAEGEKVGIKVTQGTDHTTNPVQPYTPGTHKLQNGDTITIQDGRYTRINKDGTPQGGGSLDKLEQSLKDNNTDFVDTHVRQVGTPVPPAAAPAKPSAHPPSQGQAHATPEGSHHGGQVHAEGHGTIPHTVDTINIPALNKTIGDAFGGLKKTGDHIDIGGVGVKKEGLQYRVKTHDGEFVLPKKEAIDKVSSVLQHDAHHANDAIKDGVKKMVTAIPEGSSKTINWNGADYTIRKAPGAKDVELVGPGGKVLSEADTAKFYADKATEILSPSYASRITSFLQAHGNEKADPKTFAKWWGKERAFYNPMTPFKGIVNLTWNEILAPVNTAKAVKEAFTTSGNPLSWMNNIAKAVFLRNVHTDWFSGATVGKLVISGTVVTGATGSISEWVFGPNLISNVLQTASLPYLLSGINQGPGSVTNQNDMAITGASMYYGGYIWGILVQEFLTDARPLSPWGR